MKLTEHFTLAELTQSSTALRTGIKNIPSPNTIGNLKILCEGLEQIRALLGSPLFITSGYRSQTLNRFIGGSANSAHCLGFAADFKCPQFGDPIQVVRAIKDSNIKYDQLIAEGDKGGWIHVSFALELRQQTLSALFDNKGKASYRPFV
jgi:zinc D-Ala-D-Ala carboxypeptidase